MADSSDKGLGGWGIVVVAFAGLLLVLPQLNKLIWGPEQPATTATLATAAAAESQAPTFREQLARKMYKGPTKADVYVKNPYDEPLAVRINGTPFLIAPGETLDTTVDALKVRGNLAVTVTEEGEKEGLTLYLADSREVNQLNNHRVLRFDYERP